MGAEETSNLNSSASGVEPSAAGQAEAAVDNPTAIGAIAQDRNAVSLTPYEQAQAAEANAQNRLKIVEESPNPSVDLSNEVVASAVNEVAQGLFNAAPDRFNNDIDEIEAAALALIKNVPDNSFTQDTVRECVESAIASSKLKKTVEQIATDGVSHELAENRKNNERLTYLWAELIPAKDLAYNLQPALDDIAGRIGGIDFYADGSHESEEANKLYQDLVGQWNNPQEFRRRLIEAFNNQDVPVSRYFLNQFSASDSHIGDAQNFYYRAKRISDTEGVEGLLALSNPPDQQIDIKRQIETKLEEALACDHEALVFLELNARNGIINLENEKLAYEKIIADAPGILDDEVKRAALVDNIAKNLRNRVISDAQARAAVAAAERQKLTPEDSVNVV